jgi:hypothetical protein
LIITGKQDLASCRSITSHGVCRTNETTAAMNGRHNTLRRDSIATDCFDRRFEAVVRRRALLSEFDTRFSAPRDQSPGRLATPQL